MISGAVPALMLVIRVVGMPESQSDVLRGVGGDRDPLKIHVDRVRRCGSRERGTLPNTEEPFTAGERVAVLFLLHHCPTAGVTDPGQRPRVVQGVLRQLPRR